MTGPRSLSPKQARSIAQATYSDRLIHLWEGAVRAGKTIGSLLAWALFVDTAPPGGALVVTGRTYDTIARNVFGPLADPELFGEIAPTVHYTRGSSTGQILGRTVEVISAQDAKAEPRIRGLTCAGLYADELSVLPRDYFLQGIARCSVPGAKIFATTNPEGPNHWLLQEFILRALHTSLMSWRFTLDDNPFLAPGYVANLKSTYTGLWYKRAILGEWAAAQGAIYDMWDPARHVVPAGKLPHIVRWPATGIDYGTANPFAALTLGLGDDGRLYFTDEWRYDSRAAQRQLTDAEYSARYRTWLQNTPRPQELAGAGQARGVHPEFHVVDPSAASFKVQLYRDGLRTTDAVNDVLDGVRLVSSLLATDRLKVSDSCTGWIKEIPGYVWDAKAQDEGRDEPVKKDDHSLDAGRYPILTTEYLWERDLREPEVLAA